ncbi:hypothetical protein Tco_0116929 [Tanacetum coccineum]
MKKKVIPMMKYEKENYTEGAALKKDDLNVGQNDIRLEDPFNIYDLLNKKQDNIIGGSSSDNMKKQVERYDSIFNVQGADAFNSFISDAGLEEVPLGVCSFTWCHKLATKMRQLDHFIISEGSKVGGLMSHVQSWNEIVNNLVARLSNWKMKTLSIAGRLTLLKSVLGVSSVDMRDRVVWSLEGQESHQFFDQS